MITDIERDVAEHIEAYRRNEPEALIGALLQVAQPDIFQALTKTIMGDQRMLERAVLRSSIHNNGFLKIIISTSDDYQVRLHVWDGRDEGSAVQESVHSHTADFVSMIIMGGYRHEQFREVPHGEPYYSYSYHASRGSRSFR